MPEPMETSKIPHGIMGLQPQPWPWGSWLAGALLLLLGVLLGWLLWKRQRQRAARKLASAVPLPIDPWDRMQQSLAALALPEPWTRAACEEFFFQLSFILREAVALRTGLPITGQTLAETRTSLGKNPLLSANFQQDLLKFLSLAEQLKFAGQWLSADESQAWREKVREWLELLRQGAQA